MGATRRTEGQRARQLRGGVLKVEKKRYATQWQARARKPLKVHVTKRLQRRAKTVFGWDGDQHSEMHDRPAASKHYALSWAEKKREGSGKGECTRQQCTRPDNSRFLHFSGGRGKVLPGDEGTTTPLSVLSTTIPDHCACPPHLFSCPRPLHLPTSTPSPLFCPPSRSHLNAGR